MHEALNLLSLISLRFYSTYMNFIVHVRSFKSYHLALDADVATMLPRADLGAVVPRHGPYHVKPT
jgi:hypothetical protein